MKVRLEIDGEINNSDIHKLSNIVKHDLYNDKSTVLRINNFDLRNTKIKYKITNGC